MDFVTIHHAGLDRSARVPETAVPAFADSGWTTDAAPQSDDDQHEQPDDTPLTDASTQGSPDIKES